MVESSVRGEVISLLSSPTASPDEKSRAGPRGSGLGPSLRGSASDAPTVNDHPLLVVRLVGLGPTWVVSSCAEESWLLPTPPVIRSPEGPGPIPFHCSKTMSPIPNSKTPNHSMTSYPSSLSWDSYSLAPRMSNNTLKINYVYSVLGLRDHDMYPQL